jgi:hypothetical protein
VDDLADDLGFGGAGGEQPDLLGGQQMIQADGQAPGGGLGVVEVFRGGSDGLGMEFDPAGWAIGRGAGFVHAEVTVEANAEEGEVESRADGEVEVTADVVQIGGAGVEDVEFCRGQVDMVDEMMAEHIGASTGIVGREVAEFIEGEDLGIAKGGQALAMAGDHGGIERVGGMARGQTDFEAGASLETVAPEAGGGINPGLEGIEAQEVHGSECPRENEPREPKGPKGVELGGVLFGALIDPGAEQRDLFLGERRIVFAHIDGRHFHIKHEVGDVVDDGAFGAFAGDDGGFIAIAAFDERLAGGNDEAAFGAVAAVAFEAGGLDDFLDMLVEGNAGLAGWGGKFGNVRYFVSGVGGDDGSEETASGEGGESGGDVVHNHFGAAFEQKGLDRQTEKRLASAGVNLLK